MVSAMAFLRLPLNIAAFCCWFTVAVAQNSSTEFDIDPYLQYRPAFARSLPIQILLTGVVLTLVAVLLIHLVFTAQYHWPLAPVNYVLQVSGVTTLLISLIATLHVVLSATLSESEKWPYMLSYIAVYVPPLDAVLDSTEWSVAERATWLLMNASTSGLIQITHIQFLTLLYPSRLEGRLIFTLLGPLAILSAIMQLLPIQANTQVNDVASAIRNVCNATLSLLFTVALFIWGLLVNRRQAWRTDGGTAAFGCAALSLALVSTALNFLYVPRQEEYVWLPSLMWAVVLWQSFLGWWWWVGAGSGSGLTGDDDLESKLKRKAKRELRRREAKERRQATKKRAKTLIRGVAGAFGNREDEQATSQANPHVNSETSNEGLPSSPSECQSSTTPPGSPSQGQTDASTLSVSSTGTLPRLLPQIVHGWYASLRRAHLAAAREQAVERVERIRELERSAAADTAQHGWTLGSFGWRIRREAESNRAAQLRASGSFGSYDGREWGSNQQGEGQQHGLDQGRDRIGRKEHQINIDDAPDERVENGQEEKVDNVEVPASPAAAVPSSETQRSSSMWWWGPLERWRLQDSTVY